MRPPLSPLPARRPPALLAPTLLLISAALSGCGSGGAPTSSAAASSGASGPAVSTPQAVSRSGKRGVAYDFAQNADLSAVSGAAGWWYDYSPTINGGLPAGAASANNMEFVPMLWNFSFDVATVEKQIRAQGGAKYLLVLNEPNLTDQSNTTPQDAAAQWPKFEQVSRDLGLPLVGPAMTWGNMSGYQDPVAWLDAFYSAYRQKNGRDPQLDYLAFHWYDYGLSDQLDRLKKYNKPFWVTEFANWHTGDGSAAIDSSAKQQAQMEGMVQSLEGRADVFRYAWFTGRWNNDVHYTSLLAGGAGTLTSLGQDYLRQPVCAQTNVAAGRAASASSTENGGTPASAAVDGNLGTRWSSAASDPQSLTVDLGAVTSICGVTLSWEAAYGRSFQIQTSTDNQNWTTVYSTTTGAGGTQEIGLSGSGRYVRMYGAARGTGYGYSLYEMSVRKAQ